MVDSVRPFLRENKIMNKKTFLAVSLLAFAFTVSAQVGPKAITLATNRVTAATTNSTAGTAFDISGETMVNIGLNTYSTNTGTIGVGDTTATFTLRFYGSIDNTTYYQDGTNLDCVVTQGTTNAQNNAFRLTTTSWKYLRPEKLMLNSTQLVVYPAAVYFYK